jgi:hypothetical protein
MKTLFHAGFLRRASFFLLLAQSMMHHRLSRGGRGQPERQLRMMPRCAFVEVKVLCGRLTRKEHELFAKRKGVADQPVRSQAARVHSRQHKDVGAYVIVDSQNTLGIMKSVETSYVLLERSLPGNGHRQKERIQAGIVEPFAYVAAGRQNDSRLVNTHLLTSE